MIKLFPNWKTVARRKVNVKRVSAFFNLSYEEESVLVVQRSRYGEHRCYLKNLSSEEKVSADYVKAVFPEMFKGPENG